ncbi:hypothetical protein LPJ64_004357 [Coemansia asiatica]|uniref:Transcription factor Pcc1 n=1 Tax=Coemansia asiatica TaxID=1052880 RepID=A0A9W7XGA8_9FUNG|nr:hypothetical protein LPJ64_004357 [Coemansia asiatica]
MDTVELLHSTTLTIPFATADLATIALSSLAVDREISEGKVRRTLTAQENKLIVTFDADTLRMLRVSINGFMDSLILVAKTLESFANK